MSVLQQLEPQAVFSVFEALSAIPRGSGKEKKVSDWIVSEGKKLGLCVYQDEAHNVIIKKPGTTGYEQSAPVILQGHMDMVCEKEEGLDFDFETDGLRLMVDGDFVTADGTTLGGDDGIAVAMMLAILASKDMAHPPIEAVFTSDEEAGMNGIRALDCAQLSGRRLINLDSEEEGHILSCCAGGMKAITSLPLHWEKAKADSCFLELFLNGLAGGHSGSDIHLQRANAHQLMGRLLGRLRNEAGVAVVSVNGGNMDNAIARSCRAVVACGAEEVEMVKEKAALWLKEMEAEYAGAENDMALDVTKAEAQEEVLTDDCAQKVVALLTLTPFGVQTMSLAMPGLVESSNNLGIVRTSKEAFTVTCAGRSSVESRKHFLSDRLSTLASLMGASYSEHGDYPAWEYEANSPLRETMVTVYEQLFGQKPQVDAIHAGLECGMFAKSIPGIDMASIGPDLFDVHTTKERMSISSVARTWQYLQEILRNLK